MNIETTLEAILEDGRNYQVAWESAFRTSIRAHLEALVAEPRTFPEWLVLRATREDVARLEADNARLRAELLHLVKLLAPELEAGRLHVPGLATLNGAMDALSPAATSQKVEAETAQNGVVDPQRGEKEGER